MRPYRWRIGTWCSESQGKTGQVAHCTQSGATHRGSLNSASFLPLGIAKPNRLPAESSAGHHGDFHMEPLKICACICFKRLSVPLCVSAGAVSSLWPPTVGWLGGPDPASLAWVVPIPVHPSSCSAWLTQPTPAQGPWLGRGLGPPSLPLHASDSTSSPGR